MIIKKCVNLAVKIVPLRLLTFLIEYISASIMVVRWSNFFCNLKLILLGVLPNFLLLQYSINSSYFALFLSIIPIIMYICILLLFSFSYVLIRYLKFFKISLLLYIPSLDAIKTFFCLLITIGFFNIFIVYSNPNIAPFFGIFLPLSFIFMIRGFFSSEYFGRLLLFLFELLRISFSVFSNNFFSVHLILISNIVFNSTIYSTGEFFGMFYIILKFFKISLVLKALLFIYWALLPIFLVLIAFILFLFIPFKVFNEELLRALLAILLIFLITPLPIPGLDAVFLMLFCSLVFNPIILWSGEGSFLSIPFWLPVMAFVCTLFDEEFFWNSYGLCQISETLSNSFVESFDNSEYNIYKWSLYLTLFQQDLSNAVDMEEFIRMRYITNNIPCHLFLPKRYGPGHSGDVDVKFHSPFFKSKVTDSDLYIPNRLHKNLSRPGADLVCQTLYSKTLDDVMDPLALKTLAPLAKGLHLISLDKDCSDYSKHYRSLMLLIRNYFSHPGVCSSVLRNEMYSMNISVIQHYYTISKFIKENNTPSSRFGSFLSEAYFEHNSENLDPRFVLHRDCLYNNGILSDPYFKSLPEAVQWNIKTLYLDEKTYLKDPITGKETIIPSGSLYPSITRNLKIIPSQFKSFYTITTYLPRIRDIDIEVKSLLESHNYKKASIVPDNDRLRLKNINIKLDNATILSYEVLNNVVLLSYFDNLLNRMSSFDNWDYFGDIRNY